MSAPTNKVAPAPSKPPAKQKPGAARNDYAEAVELMKRMGSKNGFNPMPPDQHAWTIAKDQEDVPPLFRLWGWMCGHTIHWGHRKEYAVNKDGLELHIEHMAADLEMDEGNARRSWREGEERGLWRNGTKAEGSRKLFLCGTVRQSKPADEPEDPDEKVCTDLFPKEYRALEPAYIRQQVRALPEQQQRDFWAKDIAHDRLRKDVQAEITAATRIIFDQHKNTIYDEFGINKIREVRKTDLTPEEVAARDARLGTVVPVIERYVQTFSGSVQSSENGVYSPNPDAAFGSVQPPSGLPTLLPIEHPLENGLEGVRALPDVSPPHQETPHRDGEKLAKLLPTVGKPEATTEDEESEPERTPKKLARGDAETERLQAYLSTHKPADHTQEEILYSGIPALQKRYPAAPFSQKKFSALGKGDQALAKQILAALNGEDAAEFLQSVERRCEAGGVKSLGLLPELARDFHRAAPERAKRRAEWEAQEHRAEEITAAGKRRQEAEAAFNQRVEERWEKMAAPEKLDRMTEARTELKKSEVSFKLSTPAQQQERMKACALSKLRQEMSEAQSKVKGATP